jgi:hypothetical protein
MRRYCSIFWRWSAIAAALARAPSMGWFRRGEPVGSGAVAGVGDGTARVLAFDLRRRWEEKVVLGFFTRELDSLGYISVESKAADGPYCHFGPEVFLR